MATLAMAQTPSLLADKAYPRVVGTRETRGPEVSAGGGPDVGCDLTGCVPCAS